MASADAPTRFYRDPGLFERERSAIFARTWQFWGLEADLSRVGDYQAQTLAGYPLVVVRDEQRQLRGYHNVCRHRAGPLVNEAKGRCEREFVCQFHQWRYGFDGALREAVDFAPPEGFDPGGLGLFPVQVETWRGFVFVNLDAAASPLMDLLGPVEARFGPRSDRTAILRDRHPVACNWKVYVENYLDGEHLEGVHGHHAHHDHEVFIEGEVAVCGEPHEAAANESLWAWIWPNLGLTVYRGVLLLEHMRPDGPDRTQVEHLFLHAPEDPGVDAAIVASERITEGHTRLCERVQQNLNAGMFRQGVLSPTQERAVAWFQARTAAAVGDAA